MLRYGISNVQGSEQRCRIQCDRSTNVTVGRVHLMRRLTFKREFFVPFLPTKYVLLLFPTFKPLDDKYTISDDTVTVISAFVAWLAHSSEKSFVVLDLLICTHSGCVVAILDCNDVLTAIDVLSVSQERAAPCVGSRCVLSFSCDRDAMSAEELQEKYYTIPTCTICAERLEPTLTGYTSRTCRCAPEKECRCFLEESSCVVCQALLRMQRDHTAIQCEVCNITGDQWICILCGFVGCSRYQKMHARDHFVQERHFFSMSFVSQQIWDYDSDAFVHRIVVAFDTETGGAYRTQYPDRDTFPESLEDEMAESFIDKAKKKHINAKFDSTVETSNKGFALMIKNDLDTRRSGYEAELRLLAQSSASGENGNDDMDECEDFVYDMMHSDPVYNTDHANWLSLFLANQNLKDELHKRQEEEAALAASLDAHEQELRATVQRYVEEERRLLDKIADARETVAQVAMNVQLKKRLDVQLDGDTAQRVVVTGNGHKTGGKNKKERRR